MQGSPAYKALQQSLCEEAHRRMQAVEQLQEVRRQLEGSDRQAKCWERAAESGAAKIAELQDNFAREQRYCTIKQQHFLRPQASRMLESKLYHATIVMTHSRMKLGRLCKTVSAIHLHALSLPVEHNPYTGCCSPSIHMLFYFSDITTSNIDQGFQKGHVLTCHPAAK